MAMPAPSARGTVYFVYGGGLLKIGFASDLDHRLKTLRNGCPVPLHLVAFIASGSTVLEKQLHKKFWQAREHGEWFRITNAISLFLKRDDRVEMAIEDDSLVLIGRRRWGLRT